MDATTAIISRIFEFGGKCDSTDSRSMASANLLCDLRFEPHPRSGPMGVGSRARDPELGIKRILIEGGGVTNSAFLRAGRVDEVSLAITDIPRGIALQSQFPIV